MPFRAGDNTNKVVDLYHLRVSRQTVEDAIVDVLNLSTERGGSDNSAVKHAGDTNFLHVPIGAFGLGRDVHTRDGFAEHLPCRWIVRHRISIDRKIKTSSLDQLTVAHRGGRISADR